jgi:predicted KAP-like P-loop ATPase
LTDAQSGNGPRKRRLASDQPIPGRAGDRLGRARLAEVMATEVLEGPRDDGFVIALHGAWGSGKTSVLNMVREDIGDQAAVVLFNPWLFSDAEQLVDRFFSEVNAQLEGDQGLSSVRGLFNEYREVVSPLVPIVFGRFGAIAAALTEGASKRKQRRRASARESYERLKAALREADRQIVVVIDDIDRLTPHEIREVIRLIKAVADLPNVTYLLAFARPRVEAALGLGEEDGAEYLEKIVQLSHTVPPIPAAVLRQLALDALGETLDGFELDHLDRSSWAVIFQSGIAPMLSTVRDAYRLANAAPAIATLVGDEVAIQDLLGLEALRLFAPDFHALLPQMVDIVGGGERLDVRDSHVIRDEHAGRGRVAWSRC